MKGKNADVKQYKNKTISSGVLPIQYSVLLILEAHDSTLNLQQISAIR